MNFGQSGFFLSSPITDQKNGIHFNPIARIRKSLRCECAMLSRSTASIMRSFQPLGTSTSGALHSIHKTSLSEADGGMPSCCWIAWSRTTMTSGLVLYGCDGPVCPTTRQPDFEPLCFWTRIYALPGPMGVNTMLLSHVKCLENHITLVTMLRSLRNRVNKSEGLN